MQGKMIFDYNKVDEEKQNFDRGKIPPNH